MTKKKKTRRSQKKYPNLIPEYNLKLRRDYIDNHHYVSGVKNKNGDIVMDALTEEAKSYLNQFNKEYYSASFQIDEETRLHKQLLDDEAIKNIKAQIKSVKNKRSKIFNKDAEKTTEKDRQLASMYNEQIEDLLDFLKKVHPRKDCEDRNNSRNRCFVNRNKASNEVSLVSWESVDPESVVMLDSELYYQYITKLEGED